MILMICSKLGIEALFKNKNNKIVMRSNKKSNRIMRKVAQMMKYKKLGNGSK